MLVLIGLIFLAMLIVMAFAILVREKKAVVKMTPAEEASYELKG